MTHEDAFREMASGIFAIEICWDDQDGPHTDQGTAFTLARIEPSNQLLLATAKHLVEIPDNTPAQWTVRQYDQFGVPFREIQFKTESYGSMDGLGAAFGFSKATDHAWIRLPRDCADGHIFAIPNESRLRMVDRDKGASTATRVGWAGFPVDVQRKLASPSLCYFEGVISATIDRERPLYVVDGHVLHGVSGGPIWHVENGHATVLGIASEYWHGAKFTDPGLCVFESINALLEYVMDNCDFKINRQGD